MDLQKFVSGRDSRFKKYFDLFNRLESTLDFDDHNPDASFDTQSIVSKVDQDH